MKNDGNFFGSFGVRVRAWAGIQGIYTLKLVNGSLSIFTFP